MEPALAARAFEPFVTTKPRAAAPVSARDGLRPGKQSNGFVWVESAPKAGTRVIVLLPTDGNPVTARRRPGGARDGTARAAGGAARRGRGRRARAALAALGRDGFDLVADGRREEAVAMAVQPFEILLTTSACPGSAASSWRGSCAGRCRRCARRSMSGDAREEFCRPKQKTPVEDQMPSSFRLAVRDATVVEPPRVAHPNRAGGPSRPQPYSVEPSSSWVRPRGARLELLPKFPHPARRLHPALGHRLVSRPRSGWTGRPGLLPGTSACRGFLFGLATLVVYFSGQCGWTRGGVLVDVGRPPAPLGSVSVLLLLLDLGLDPSVVTMALGVPLGAHRRRGPAAGRRRRPGWTGEDPARHAALGVSVGAVLRQPDQDARRSRRLRAGRRLIRYVV